MSPYLGFLHSDDVGEILDRCGLDEEAVPGNRLRSPKGTPLLVTTNAQAYD